MPYIIVEFAGQKTFGGYLQIDGGKQIQLFDDLIIPVDPGTHYLNFSTQTTAQRNLAKLNVAVGNYRTAAWAEKDSVDGEISQEFDEDEVMIFTVVSDAKGHILDQPRFSFRVLNEEEMKEIDTLYAQQGAAISEMAEGDKKNALIELILCFFLGMVGGHRFYRKQYGMGILYLFTGGLFGIGMIIDLIKIIKRLMG